LPPGSHYNHSSGGHPAREKEKGMALTERQQQIVDLQKEGKKADEIGKALGVSTNAVYQQIRRMRKDKPGRSRAAAAKSAPKSAPKSSATATVSSSSVGVTESTNSSSTAAAPRTMTPLQAIRARRDEIRAALKATEQTRAEAERVLKAATEAHEKATAKHTDELAALDAAESAIKGDLKLPTSKPKRQSGSSRTNGAKSGASTPAAPAAPQAPQETPQATGATDNEGFHDVAAERDAQDAAAEAPQTPQAPVAA
jgi:DNA-binding CsgD family transcriptional regulator